LLWQLNILLRRIILLLQTHSSWSAKKI